MEEDNNAKVMNHQQRGLGIRQQQQQKEEEQAAVVSVDDDDDESDNSFDDFPLERYDRVQFWKTSCGSPSQREATLGVVVGLSDNNGHVKKATDDEDYHTYTIHQSCVKIVMLAAFWKREVFKRWCQQGIIDTPCSHLDFGETFRLHQVDYEETFLDDEMAYELENTLERSHVKMMWFL